MSKVEAGYARSKEANALEQLEVEAVAFRAISIEFEAEKSKDSEISTLKECLEVVNSEYEAQAEVLRTSRAEHASLLNKLQDLSK
eukprot:1501568-Karenia_brevis.AAC.1